MENSQPQGKKLSFSAVASMIIVIVVLLALAYYLQAVKDKNNQSATQNPPPPPQTQPGNKNFTNQEYGLELAYPAEFILVENGSSRIPQQSYLKSSSTILGSIEIPQELYPKTNLGQAFLSVSAAKDSNATNCTQAKDFNLTNNLTATKKVGEQIYYFAETTGAAAGSRYEVKVYHVIKNGFCFEFNANVSYGNIQNYEPGAVTEINSGDLFAKLENIIASAKFVAPQTAVKIYTNAQAGFSFNYPVSVAVGDVAKNSVLGTADNLVSGIYVGNYVFIAVSDPVTRKDANDYMAQLVNVARNPLPPQEEGMPVGECKTETVKNTVSIQLVACIGDGGPAVYGLIKGSSYDIFIDGYSRGWDGSKDLKNLPNEDLKKILETFKFTN